MDLILAIILINLGVAGAGVLLFTLLSGDVDYQEFKSWFKGYSPDDK
jgi:hypothetical protein